MDGFSIAREFTGREEKEKNFFLSRMKPANKEISMKRATRIGKYLYITEEKQLVSLALIKILPKGNIARGLLELKNNLKIYLFTEEDS